MSMSELKPTVRQQDDGAAALSVSGLTVEYPARHLGETPVRAVRDVTFTVGRSRTLGLVGESGSGKSSIARAIMRLAPVTAGRIELNGIDLGAVQGKELRRRRASFQMVFQDPFGSFSPWVTVGASLHEPLKTHRTMSRYERNEYIATLLGQVGLDESYAARYPRELSGGQLQRIAIARAIALEPALVILDEAVSALDVSTQSQVLGLLAELQEQLKLTYLFISHDLAVVDFLADDIGVMYAGELVELGAAEVVFNQPAHPYTQALLAATPRPHPRLRRNNAVVRGDSVDIKATDSGCSFRGRCTKAMDICASPVPWIAVEPSRSARCHLLA